MRHTELNTNCFKEQYEMFVLAHIFRESTVNRFICCDMVELQLIPQLLDDKPHILKT
jgi:hypothetical protein